MSPDARLEPVPAEYVRIFGGAVPGSDSSCAGISACLKRHARVLGCLSWRFITNPMADAPRQESVFKVLGLGQATVATNDGAGQ